MKLWLKLGVVVAVVGFAWWWRGGREFCQRLLSKTRDEATDVVIAVSEEAMGAVLDETKAIILEIDES